MNWTFDLDLASWAVIWRRTDMPVGSRGWEGHGVYPTFTAAKEEAVRLVKMEVDEAREGLRRLRSTTKPTHTL